MEGSPAILEAEDSDVEGRTPAGASRRRAKRVASARGRLARNAFDAWREISALLRDASRYALFLDFDGTLVNFRRHPGDVNPSARVNRTIVRLVRHSNAFVAIVSGRKVRDLRRFVPVKGLHYFGVQGGERDAKPVALSKRSKVALDRAKRDARSKLAHLPRVWIEDKRLSFCVHYRNADPDTARAAGVALRKLLAPFEKSLHVLNGRLLWEVVPREIPGKFAVVEDILKALPADCAAIYIGDDDTDELAFIALKTQISIRVGTARGTRARYWLPAPADVLRFLDRVEGELR
jgi:trehalose 6-phosphate phosphatase